MWSHIVNLIKEGTALLFRKVYPMYNNNIFKFSRLTKHDAIDSVPHNGTLIMLPNKFYTARFQYNPISTQNRERLKNNAKWGPCFLMNSSISKGLIDLALSCEGRGERERERNEMEGCWVGFSTSQ